MGVPASDVLSRENADYLESLHAQFLRDPAALDPQWQAFFTGFEAAAAGPWPAATIAPQPPAAAAPVDHRLAEGVADLVHSYRELGHCNAQLDPLGHHRPPNPLLELGEFGLSEADLDRPISSTSFLGPPAGTLRELVEQLQATYCHALGVEYMGITDRSQRQWLQEQMEPVLNRPEFSTAQSQRVLELLVAADTFEKFLHAKFLGQKRFSIEGADALVPLLDTLTEDGAALGIEEIVLGMAHRGRLNVSRADQAAHRGPAANDFGDLIGGVRRIGKKRENLLVRITPASRRQSGQRGLRSQKSEILCGTR